MSIDSAVAADLIYAFWDANRARDRAALLNFCAESVVVALFIPQEVLPFGGGETHGKAAASDRMQTVFDQFETLQYDGTVTSASDDRVRGQVLYSFRHKATGEVIEGVMRQVIDLKDGKIVCLHEFHDVERIRAFMRLVSYIAQE